MMSYNEHVMDDFRKRYPQALTEEEQQVDLGLPRHTKGDGLLYCSHHECKSKLFHRYLKTTALFVILLMIVHMVIYTENGGKEIMDLMKKIMELTIALSASGNGGSVLHLVSAENTTPTLDLNTTVPIFEEAEINLD